MALPYKLLKSITIGGETMNLDENVGKIYSATATKTLTSTNYEPIVSVTPDESGTYIIVVENTYTPATTSGENVVYAGYSKNGTAAINAVTSVMPSPRHYVNQSVAIATLTEGQPVYAMARSLKTLNGAVVSIISIVQLPNYSST